MPIPIQFPALMHGGDYNPEQWPEDVWDEDVRLMLEAHVNIVTLPVFGWASLQPNEETFTFEWLDKIIEKLHHAGIRICMATATASVPAWLDQKYPDVLVVNKDGRKHKHGGRHIFCPNSPNFRRLSTNLTRKLAERYEQHPALLLWHISNEYGNYCFCDRCADAFRAWLQTRYGSLEELNDRWTTKFWGHTFTDWSQVETPSTVGEWSIEALHVDYGRFQTDSLLGCFKAEVAVLREITPYLPITTNLMGSYQWLDYHAWAREMDIVSWDSYPGKHDDPAHIAFQHSLMRGLKEGAPFMLIEQTPSQVNWQRYNALKRPGRMRLLSYQAIAHGPESVMYFQWRQSRGGPEKFHGAVASHEGTSKPRVFQEVAALGKELQSLGTRTLGGRVPASAAVLFDWNNWWAIQHSCGPTTGLDYLAHCRSYYTALHRSGILTDVISPEADLERYNLVVAPILFMVKPGVAEKLEAFVQRGGTLITTFLSGLVDENNRAYLGGYPGPLRRLLGIWAEEIDVLHPNDINGVIFENAFGDLTGEYLCKDLCDRVHLETAKALANYTQDFYAGEPAITVNEFGKGHAYYIATVLEEPTLQDFFAQVCKKNGMSSPLSTKPPQGVEVTQRVSSSGETLTYVLNHNTEAVTVNLPKGEFIDLLTQRKHSGEIELEGYGVAILT